MNNELVNELKSMLDQSVEISKILACGIAERETIEAKKRAEDKRLPWFILLFVIILVTLFYTFSMIQVVNLHKTTMDFFNDYEFVYEETTTTITQDTEGGGSNNYVGGDNISIGGDN